MFKQLRTLFLADATPTSRNLSSLETSWDVRVSIRRLRQHEWTKWDIQYLILIPILLFCLFICEEPPFVFRLGLALLILLAVSLPITSQFFLYALPIITWLLLFYSTRFIPSKYRPPIQVRVLPALETILYGGDLSQVLASFTHPALDLLAWIPYGLIHYGSPFVVAGVLWLFGPPKILRVFGFAFGWNNLIGVIIQNVFPTAPPWYQNLYGLDPANYSIHGSAGGLERIDKLLGLNMYSGAFDASPLVFGAFPSLHSGFAVMEALFLSHVFPRLSPLFFGYLLWIWWSTMYLTHHYFVDLICGACIAFSIFYVCKLTILPRVQQDKFGRWSYDYVETGVAKPAKLRKSIDVATDPEDLYIELPRLQTAFPPVKNYNNYTNNNGGSHHHHHHHHHHHPTAQAIKSQHHKTSSYHHHFDDVAEFRATSSAATTPSPTTAASKSNWSSSPSPVESIASASVASASIASAFMHARSMSPRSADEITLLENRQKLA
uniref:ARAD1B01892p n=1 Tax=Blastobotrys adeninivorans TaxID=409370 RepID=A0A060T565_BLAAD